MFFIQQYIFEKKKKHLQVAHHTRCAFFYSNDTQTRQRNHNDVAMNPNERPK